MEHSSRHLRFKLQSLGRRLDDLEEATRNLQKAEDEVLDLQDKIIQAEGSNSSMLADVEALRKRVLKIEGKDEEVKKAEDLCRLIKEKLENEENVTRELRLEIDLLQKRMSELEKLEEAFSKSKSDCTQLGLSLNEEKNMSKKLSSELELFKTRITELEASENRLDKAEQVLTSELEKIKTLALSFANERKRMFEREKQLEKTILELREQLELKEKMSAEQTRNESNLLERSMDQHGEHQHFKIEDTIDCDPVRVGLAYIKHSDIQTSSKKEKNKPQEDNKIKELNQEIEKLKNQLKHFEGLEEELKLLKEKNSELQENVINEQSKNKQLTDECQAFKRQANQLREVENGILDSDDLSHSRIKSERPRNKVASTEPLSKYTSRDVSPQHNRSERLRNTETTYKRQFSNGSSSSRKSSRSVLADTTGNQRKPEDKISTSSYKDLSTTQNEFKKSKEQPSVLSRYPPASQEQLAPKSWRNSTGKKTDQSLKLFGEDYSSKAYSKREVSLENEDLKGRSTEGSENGTNANLHEEIIPVENCTVSSSLILESVNHSPDVTNVLEMNVQSESSPRSFVNLEDVHLTGRERLSKYSRSSRDDVAKSYEETSKSYTSSRDEGESQKNPTSISQRSYNREIRSKSSKPLIPEKPHILESLDYREVERRVRLSSLHKRQSSPRDENHSVLLQREGSTDLLRKTSSDGSGSSETNLYTATRTRSCSPRESLQCTVVTKPLIIEKDMKESMSEYRARSFSEANKSQVSTTPNKVTSSITIYPTEPVSTRTNIESSRRERHERHTSTSNIRLSANDPPVLKNNIMVPLEFSLTKEDGLLKVENADKGMDYKETSKVIDESLNKDHTKGIDSEPVTNSWKSIDMLETNHLDSKPGSRSSWRKGLYGSSEELDRLDRELTEAKNRRKSCFDESVRVRNYELSSRNKSSSVSSWSATPEFISKRSQSNLTAREIVSRRSPSNDSGYTSFSRSSLDVDDTFSSRRKYSDRLGRTDATGWRQSQNQSQRQKGMVEERIRQLEH